MHHFSAAVYKGGTTTTPSGLHIEVLEAGPAGGSKPTVADRVRVDYEGRPAGELHAIL